MNFYINNGNSDSSSSSCDYGETTDEGVIADYSSNGGITWNNLKDFQYYSYRGATPVGVTLPNGAQTSSTRFRIWQPYNSGSGQDEWAIDEFYIGGSKVRYLKVRISGHRS